MSEHTTPSRATRQAEAEEAQKSAGPDRGPTESEAAIADGHPVSPTVADHEKEMNERGAGQAGEGRIA